MLNIKYSAFGVQGAGVRSQGIRMLAGIAAAICLSSCPAPGASIPDTELAALKADLAEATRASSAAEMRRACKAVVRKLDSHLEAYPDAENKFEALALLFEGQKRLLALDATESNRSAIYETCTRLKHAPDEYAETRFDAEMILSEKALAEADAEVAERIEALRKILAKYRGTPAELKSLKVGALIAEKLLDFDLEKEISDTIAERFGGDHEVITFRRQKDMGATIDAVFTGAYNTASGSLIKFPYDLIGHQYIVCFWSTETPELNTRLQELKEMQNNDAGLLKIFSCNVDSLPDAGAGVLRKMNLDWTALMLPGGRQSSAYKAYATRDPVFILVNGQGHTMLYPPPIRQGHLGRMSPDYGWNTGIIAKRLDDQRYLAQLRYLFIGDFLAEDAGGSTDADSSGPVRIVNACFTPPPLRYRLSQDESLEKYRNAEKLCADFIEKHRGSKDLPRLRNARIIALLGIANLSMDATYFEEAVKEAQTLLNTSPPAGAALAAYFCLAKKALRDGQDPEIAIPHLVQQIGPENDKALAAAAILSLEANSRTLHEKYRDQFLSMTKTDPGLMSVRSFFMDLHHRYRNLWASPGGYGYERQQKYEFRNAVSGLGDPIDRGTVEFTLKQMDGVDLNVPKCSSGEMLGVVFVEPPADVASVSNVASRLKLIAGEFKKQGVEPVLAFLSEDPAAVNGMMQHVDAGFRAGMLKEGIRNPLVRKLGILWADRIPNPILFNPDGSIAWLVSGLHYQTQGDYGTTVRTIALAIQRNIEKERTDQGLESPRMRHTPQQPHR